MQALLPPDRVGGAGGEIADWNFTATPGPASRPVIRRTPDTPIQNLKPLAGLVVTISVIAAGALFVPPARRPASVNSEPRIAVTIHPLAAILRELTGDRMEVVTLVPPGGSPHTFDPRPSDARAAGSARALFWIDPNLDGWAAGMACQRKIMVMDFIPPEFRIPSPESKSADPHFWTDPLTVKGALPRMLQSLTELDPDAREIFEANAVRFSAELDQLHHQIESTLSSVRGKPVILFHPSFLYLVHRYGLEYAGAIERAPGKEPTPRYLTELAGKMKKLGARTVFTEPQLPRGPAEALAEAAGANVAELDPNGGKPGRETYSELLLFNARVLAEALK